MPERRLELGPTGDVVRWNVARFRKAAGMSAAELSRTVSELGRPIAPLGIRRIENGERRVDVDDLTALAVALNVTPNALLLQPVSIGRIDITGATDIDAVTAWLWAEGQRPIEHSPVTMPRVLRDDAGETIEEGSVAWGRAAHRWRQHAHTIEDEDFSQRVDPNLAEAVDVPHTNLNDG